MPHSGHAVAIFVTIIYAFQHLLHSQWCSQSYTMYVLQQLNVADIKKLVALFFMSKPRTTDHLWLSMAVQVGLLTVHVAAVQFTLMNCLVGFRI